MDLVAVTQYHNNFIYPSPFNGSSMHSDGVMSLSSASGAPGSDSELCSQNKHQPVHPDKYVLVEHNLLPGCPVLLLHRSRGEEHQKHLQAVSDQPEKSHLQHFRGLNVGQFKLKQSLSSEALNKQDVVLELYYSETKKKGQYCFQQGGGMHYSQ